MEPLEVLFEDPSLHSFELHEKLAKLYGGTFGFDRDRVIANFVESIDGVTAIPESERSSQIISGGSQADRLVMGLLRAAADVVVVGAGTVRAHPKSRWSPKQAFPDLADELLQMRKELGIENDTPKLAVVTASGKIDTSHPAFAGGMIVTTASGAEALKGELSPESVLVLDSKDGDISAKETLEAFRAQGLRTILVEGGPHLLGTFVDEKVIDELFLTVSPVLAGRAKGDRPGLIAGVELLPDRDVKGTLLSVREHDSYLLLRYELA